MIAFWRKPELELDEAREMVWMEMLIAAEQNSLSLAYAMLTVIDNPEMELDQIREDLIGMITQLEYGIARFEEYVV